MNKQYKIASIIIALILCLTSLPFYADDIAQTESAEMVEDEPIPATEAVVVAIISANIGEVDMDNFEISNTAHYGLTEKRVKDLIKEGKLPEGDYYNEVIPYVYNFGDGSGDISGSSNEGSDCAYVINEKESGLQLLLMKTENEYGLTVDSAVTEAYKAAMTLQADIILLDTAVFAGYTDGSDLPVGLYDLIKEAYGKGVFTVASVGDGSLNGLFNDWYDDSIRMPVTDIPDVSSMCAPAALEEVISVASRENMYYKTVVISTADGYQFGYSDTTLRYELAGDKTFTGYFNGKSLEYAAVGGEGSAEDCAAAELDGKLALIKRGGLTFIEKVNNAYDAGAVGAIIYDNIKDNADDVLMSLEDAKAPAIFISREDGEALIAAENKTLNIKEGEVGYIKNKNGGELSDFSSRANGISALPDYTDFGGLINVTPTINENGELIERVASGTLYAAAKYSAELAGLIKECREKELGFTQRQLLAFMSNAAEPATYNGIEYSPRAQGTGDYDGDALSLTSLLSSGGESEIKLGSIMSKGFTLNFKLENLTEETQTYTLSASVLSDVYTGYYYDDNGSLFSTASMGLPISESDTPLFITGLPDAFENAVVTNGTTSRQTYQLNLHSEKFHPLSCTLKAGESRNIKLYVRLDNDAAREYEAAFKNGYYVEGYVYAEDENENVSSIPYCGYVGNYYEAPIFDTSYYNGGSVFESTYCYSYNYFSNTRSMAILGENAAYDEKFASESRIGFSPDDDGRCDELYVGFTLNRSVHDVYFNIYKADGEFLYTLPVEDSVKRSYSNDSGIQQYKVLLWDGRADDNYAYIYPDGEYYFTCFCTPDDGGRQQSFTMPFVIDTTDPVIDEYDIVEKDGVRTLLLTASDENQVQMINVSDSLAENSYNATVCMGEDTYTFFNDFDLTGLTDSVLYVTVTDYSYNVSTTRINIGD